jgi:multicomponent Na+:H+ antiporter subunit B
MNQMFPVPRVVAKLLIPFILLFGFYVQFHGDYGPGGGFQAGVIVASAFLLYGMVFGLRAVQRVMRPRWVETLAPLGVLTYAATGMLTMLSGGNYLNYEVLQHNSHFWPHGQHLGIFLVELGVGITVSSVMIAIYYAFAGRGNES